MQVKHYTEVEAEDVPAPAEGVKIRWLVNADSGAPNFAMRHFEIAPGGHTPFHQHEWEHEVFGLTGKGVLTTDDGEQPFGAGDFVLVPPNAMHNFRNTGNESLTMICMVPNT